MTTSWKSPFYMLAAAVAVVARAHLAAGGNSQFLGGIGQPPLGLILSDPGGRAIWLLSPSAYGVLAAVANLGVPDILYTSIPGWIALTISIPALTTYGFNIMVAFVVGLLGFSLLAKVQPDCAATREDMHRVACSPSVFIARLFLYLTGVFFGRPVNGRALPPPPRTKKSPDPFIAFAGLGVGAGVL